MNMILSPKEKIKKQKTVSTHILQLHRESTIQNTYIIFLQKLNQQKKHHKKF